MKNPSSPSRSNPFVFLAACAVFMLAGIMVLAWLDSPPISPAIGKTLPKINLSPLLNTESGAEADVAGSIQGKWSLIYLWGPWNSESRIGIQRIGKLVQRIRPDSRIQIVLVACPRDVLILDDLRNATQTAMNEAGLELPVYYDPDGQTSMELALLMPYGSLGFPTSVVADETGKVVRVIEGESEAEFAELEKFLLEYAR